MEWPSDYYAIALPRSDEFPNFVIHKAQYLYKKSGPFVMFICQGAIPKYPGMPQDDASYLWKNVTCRFCLQEKKR